MPSSWPRPDSPPESERLNGWCAAAERHEVEAVHRDSRPTQAAVVEAVPIIALVVAGFALLGLAVCGVPGLASIWPVLAIGAAVASLVALVLFWDRQLLWGVSIDVALIVVALWHPAWTDRLG